MLQHYSAYKVAETFNLLASLAPGRVDLGVGKAPGGFPLSTRALQAGVDLAARPDFAEQLSGINTYLAADPASEGPHATPFPPTPPERFLLGASVDSAELAAAKGWRLVFAGQLNGDPENLRKTFDAYTRASGKTPILALAAYAAEDADVARKAVGDLRIVKVFLVDGRSVNVGTEEQAAEYARQAGIAIDRLESKAPSVLHGTAAEVRAQLDDLHSRYGISEFIIETPALAAAERLASIERLAKERLSLAA
jgi:luciferase family oxidoreductase group 1